ncbi:fructose-1,6-bisphosphatase I [Rhodoligotrophos appendicifer]|uniref:class 1 fructose-bisphosphatase n=1 Tax=Rhodoligotrophos appendicifer TaxID=987056 RepID=UPI001186E0FE|nr:class 1 fructose-bisphosphatase [Rhodoligotrophos appendicifer]
MTSGAGLGLSLRDYLADTAEPGIAALVSAIADASRPLIAMIRRGPILGSLGAGSGGSNKDGDVQKALDVLADRQFLHGLQVAGVRAIASEEADEPHSVSADGEFLVAIDPLDGSSNIETNVSIGTIFSILPAAPGRSAEPGDFLIQGHRQKAAGFLIYGPQASIVFTTGTGTHAATHDPESDDFVMTALSLSIPEDVPEFAINASNYRFWHPPVQAYVNDCVSGTDGPMSRNFNMRWIASLVADAYRILMRGGAFLYPADSRHGYERGRLRHVYEASPIAFLIEQADGAATDGVNRILDHQPASLHARVPLVFGSMQTVARIRRYHLETEDSADLSPLFGRRGLMRR